MQEHVEQPTGADKGEEIEQLKQWMEHFSMRYKLAFLSKERCEQLMRRKSAKKWDQEKTAKMVRRLMVANKEIEQSENALDNASARLKELGIEVEIVSRSQA